MIYYLIFIFYFICTDQTRYPIKYKFFRYSDTKYQNDADRIESDN